MAKHRFQKSDTPLANHLFLRLIAFASQKSSVLQRPAKPVHCQSLWE